MVVGKSGYDSLRHMILKVEIRIFEKPHDYFSHFIGMFLERYMCEVVPHEMKLKGFCIL